MSEQGANMAGTAVSQRSTPNAHTETANDSILTLSSGLSREQQAGVERAMAYARELQQTVFKELLEAEQRRREEEARAAPGTNNPGQLAGMDARNLSVMSRIYVGSINFELTDEHIHRVFSEFGSVCSVSMSKDANTGRHKGYGFVEYEVPEAAALAVEVMNGTMLGGRQLKIGRPNNYSVAVAQGYPQPPPERIYVANVNEAIAEDVLKEIFAPFGAVKACVLAPDLKTRKHRGWGFIEFAEASAAEQAALAMNGFSLGNLVLRVRRCVVGGPLGEGMKALDSIAEEPASGTADVGQTAVRPPQEVIDVAASVSRSIGAEGSAARPQQTQPQQQQQQAAAAGSNIVLLGGVVGDRSEVDDDLAGDMAGEGTKCGKVAKVVVHIASEEELRQMGGCGCEVSIFVQYVEPEAALKALELFDGRWFAGRQISAQLYDPDHYRMLTSTDTLVYIP
ncbi:hypothetical protein GGI07_001921 [Coemansia sp. Benny D115]|nr:hypothetical protein GGI07_001921 [Coemansia sp. Benny D115]